MISNNDFGGVILTHIDDFSVGIQPGPSSCEGNMGFNGCGNRHFDFTIDCQNQNPKFWFRRCLDECSIGNPVLAIILTYVSSNFFPGVINRIDGIFDAFCQQRLWPKPLSDSPGVVDAGPQVYRNPNTTCYYKHWNCPRIICPLFAQDSWKEQKISNRTLDQHVTATEWQHRVRCSPTQHLPECTHSMGCNRKDNLWRYCSGGEILLFFFL